MAIEENKEIVRRLVEEVINEGNLDAIGELIAPEFEGIGSGGPEGFKQITKVRLDAFPDFHQTIEDMIAEGDKVAMRVTAHGTHQGEYPSAVFGTIPATGSKIALTETTFLRIAGGKIVQLRFDWDQLRFLQQLGVGVLSGQGQ